MSIESEESRKTLEKLRVLELTVFAWVGLELCTRCLGRFHLKSLSFGQKHGSKVQFQKSKFTETGRITRVPRTERGLNGNRTNLIFSAPLKNASGCWSTVHRGNL